MSSMLLRETTTGIEPPQPAYTGAMSHSADRALCAALIVSESTETETAFEPSLGKNVTSQSLSKFCLMCSRNLTRISSGS